MSQQTLEKKTKVQIGAILFTNEVHELICPLKWGNKKKKRKKGVVLVLVLKMYSQRGEKWKCFILRSQRSDFGQFNRFYPYTHIKMFLIKGWDPPDDASYKSLFLYQL